MIEVMTTLIRQSTLLYGARQDCGQLQMSKVLPEYLNLGKLVVLHRKFSLRPNFDGIVVDRISTVAPGKPSCRVQRD